MGRSGRNAISENFPLADLERKSSCERHNRALRSGVVSQPRPALIGELGRRVDDAAKSVEGRADQRLHV